MHLLNLAGRGEAEDEGKLRRRQTSSTDSPKGHWDFPKGHIEKGEKIKDTIRREVEEETGLKDIKFIEGFKEWIKYFFKHNADGPGSG